MGNVQSFRGRTIAEAKHAAVMALGADCMVLTTRRVSQGGWSGMFGGQEVEITAVRPEGAETPAPSVNARAARSVMDPTPALAALLRNELRAEIRQLRLSVPRAAPAPSVPPALLDELAELREAVASLHTGRGSKGCAKLVARLQHWGVEGRAVEEIIAQVADLAPSARDAAFEQAVDAVTPVCDWPIATKGRILIALVGPSGVGKTTTAAKLSARLRAEGRTVTLVSADAFRVGAVPQLQRYAELMGGLFETVRTREELVSVMTRARTDVIVVDTSGRAPKADCVEGALIPGADANELAGRARHVLLCVTAAVRARDAQAIAKSFALVHPTSLAVTKLDETRAPAGLIHGPFASQLAVSTLCAGQRVPEDITSATRASIRRFLNERGVA